MGSVLITSDVNQIFRPTAIALGNFDGLHRGHQAVIQALNQAPEILHRSVVTFTPHPQAFFTGELRPCLTPPDEKVPVLANLGITQLIRLPFNQALAQLSPADFVEQILVKTLQAQWIAVGFNFGFGYKRSGQAEDLKTLAARFNIPVSIVPPQRFGDQRISSSAIREALSQGNIAQVQELLGRPYLLQGRVIQGQGLGHKLGFPTANLALPEDKFLPRLGVYVVDVQSQGWERARPGVLNIGIRPTLETPTLTAEVHLLNWQDDLYGQVLEVQLLEFLRPEQKFASLEALTEQIHRDCHQAGDWFNTRASI